VGDVKILFKDDELLKTEINEGRIRKTTKGKKKRID